MTLVETARTFIREAPWALWWAQTRAIVRLEVGRSLLKRRSLFLYLLALAPILLLSIRLFVREPEEAIQSLGGVSVIFAILFRTFYLRLALFFGCVGVFMYLFRGEVLERTLHYYLLAPVRREVLVVAKYLAGVVVTGLVFGLSTVVSYLLLFAPHGQEMLRDFVVRGPGAGHLVAYLGVTILGCFGYGAVFLMMGLFFRNPIVPVAITLGWESINFLLPPILKKFSVIYYLESLCPVPIPEGPVTILAEPAPLWLAVPGLLGFLLLVLVIAAIRVRRLEITYGED